MMKEHVEALERLYGLSPTQMAAVRAAIELMNAAEPTSEREEDGVVSRAAYRVATAGTQHACDVAQMVKEERARVRAELLPRFKEQERLSLAIIADRDAQIAELKRAAVPKDEAAERVLCKRAAEDIVGWPEPEAAEEVHVLRAQARAEGYAKCLEGKLAGVGDDFRAQLSAAQAEIERLKSELEAKR